MLSDQLFSLIKIQFLSKPAGLALVCVCGCLRGEADGSRNAELLLWARRARGSPCRVGAEQQFWAIPAWIVVDYPKKALGTRFSSCTSYFRHQQQYVGKANLLLELSINHSLSVKLVIVKKAPKVFILPFLFSFNYYKASFKSCCRWKCALVNLDNA